MSEIRITSSRKDETVSITTWEDDQLILSVIDADDPDRHKTEVKLTARQARTIASLLHDAILDGEGEGSANGHIVRLADGKNQKVPS